MTQLDELAPDARRTYGSGREVRPVYAFGVSKKVFYCAGASVAVGVAAMLAGFLIVGLVWVGVTLAAVAPLALRFAGHTGYELVLLWRGWRGQRRARRHILRAGPLSNAPGGRTRLPGVAAPTEMWWGIDKLGRRFGLIHNPHTHQYTVRLRCSPQGNQGQEQEVINLMVADWGEYLNQSAQPGDCAAVVVVCETIPETGARLRAERDRLCAPGGAAGAQEMVRQACAGRDADRTGTQQQVAVAITWTARTAAKKRDPMVMVADVADRLPSICANLAASQVVAIPMSDHQIAAVVRRCYDPRETTEAAVEELVSGDAAALDWLDAGPVTAEETKNTYLHDGAASRVWVMNAAPSGFPTERVLEHLLAGRADVPRKRITLIYRPLSPGDAASSVHNDYLSATAAVNSTRGLASARGVLARDAAGQARREEAVGAGVVDQAMIVTVTAADPAALDAMGEVAREMSAAARLKIRPAWRYQAAAFLCGLGVGVLLPDHASIPTTLQGG